MSKKAKMIVITCVIIIICVLLYLVVPFIYKLTIMIKHNNACEKIIESNNTKYIVENYDGYNQTQITTTYYKDGIRKDIVENRDEEGIYNYNYILYILGDELISMSADGKSFQIVENYLSDSVDVQYKKLTLEPIKMVLTQKMYTTKGVVEESFLEKIEYIVDYCIPDMIPSQIITEEYEGKECYKCIFSSKMKNNKKYSTYHVTILYLDKETFLPIYQINQIYEKGDYVRKLSEDSTNKYYYELDVVKDEDVKIPDLQNSTQYMQSARP